MKRSLRRLTMTTLLLACAAAGAVAQQPLPVDMPSVLMPMGADPQSPPMEGTYAPGYEDQANCETCSDGWAFGPRRPRFCGYWGGADLLLWWNKGRHVPALVTTSDPTDGGILGQPTTVVLFGDEHIGSDLQAGGRFTLGTWLDPAAQTGLGLRFLALEGDRTGFEAESDGSTVLARPFFNVSTASENAILVGLPGFNAGDLAMRSENDFLSAEVIGRFVMGGDYASRIDLVTGYHFARLDDSLIMQSRTTILDPLNPLVGSRFDVFDNFDAENEFHGAIIGLMGERRNGCAKYSWLGKISAGNMRQEVVIDGGSTINLNGGGTLPINGGLFAQGTNIGTYTRNRFAFIPEANFNLHYQFSPQFDVSLGYSIMWFSSVALAGDQIDRQVNLTQQAGPIVGPARPVERFNITDFWFQGINFGLNWRF